MPELPEVEALAGFLRERAVGLVIAGVEVGTINVLKTFDPQPSALGGMTIDGVARHGKFLDLDVGGLHLVFHLARAGWLRWSDALAATVIRPGKGPIALRVRLADPDALDGAGSPGFDLTEAGTQKRLAVYVVRSASEVPGIAALGPDPLGPGFDREALAALLAGKRQQVKGLLRDQAVIAGVGNAYSDEVLHAARLSPFAIAATLQDGEVDRLYAALREVLTSAVAAASGKPAKELKDAKRAGMRVHARTGQPCPVCGDVVREVSFADSSLQYCATCQTGGKVLADRRMSRLLK
ncbi:MAG: Fpg/Nei family DNA glycosylase [Kineosporiaceae bacterium]|nr:Fpg/Nei family DNA glycosylase [Kineosporiaceae bacterium]